MAQYTTSSLQVGLSVVICGLIYLGTLVFYRLTLHPLAKYPGPFLAKLTSFYAVYHAYVGDMHLDIEKSHQKYGTFLRYGPNSLIVNSADGFHDIYGNGKKVKKGPGYKVHGPGNLIGVRDKKYFSRLKRIFGQGFSDAALREHEPKVLEQINSFCEKVVDSGVSEKDSTGWSTMKNMTLWCNYMTTDIITKVIFTTSWDLLETTKNRSVVHMLTQVVRYTGVGHQSKWMYKYRLSILLFPKLVMSILSLRKHTIEVINASKKAREDDPTIKDVFGQYMNAIDPETGKVLNGDSVRLNSGTIIIAGSDTSSSALSATFFYLSRNPSAYAKVAQEIRSTFKNPSEIRAGATLNNCQYLRASINEAMRLSPVVAQPLWRETEEGGCSIAGEQIPGGTVVGSGIYSLHHNPTVFPDPYTYDIERWVLPANPTDEELTVMKERNRNFAPFSTGPRQCLAKNFAVMELLLTMANVFLRMDFKNADGKESMVGEGGEAWNIQEGASATTEVPWGRQRKDEFQLKSYFTSHMEGPMIVFKRRAFD